MVHRSTSRGGRPRTARWAVVAAVVAAGVSGLVGISAAPASARVSGVSGNAFVWAYAPTLSAYTLEGPYQYNSTQPFSTAPINSIVRTGIGNYKVVLPGLAAASGTVLVTAYGRDTTNACKVISWGPSGADQNIYVVCYNTTGTPTDSPFTLSYNNRLDTGDIGWVLADKATISSYVPMLDYQGNSRGGINRITRSGVGDYQVILPNLGAGAGHVQVTAFGGGSERCKVTGWGPSGSDQVIGVRCFTVGGAPADTFYTLTYVRDTNVLDNSPVCCSNDGFPVAYAWANEPSSANYRPATSYQFSNFRSTTAVTIDRLGTGTYAVHDAYTDFGDGNVQVTAYGFGSEQCKVDHWNDQDGIVVACFTATGAPVDTLFDVSFTARVRIG